MQNELLNRIISNPEVFGGKPTVRGLRFGVGDMLELLANGMTNEKILEDFPYLEPDDIKACLLYAASELNHPN
ncbi:MAG: hypothetical protein JWN76_1869 [Chitinophagaceae bacterium]|nr:hypothetical protein [Chitinophagaceae bacterium]